MSEKKWTCEHLNLDGEKLMQPLTVGQKSLLECRGPFTDKLTPPLKLKWENDELKYTLVALETKISEGDKITLLVTGYKPGEYKDVPLVLTDELLEVKAQPINYAVASVVPQGQQPQMAGPLGPLTLNYPSWLWMGAGGVLIIAILIVAVISFFKLRYKRKLKKSLDSSLSMVDLLDSNQLGELGFSVKKNSQEAGPVVDRNSPYFQKFANTESLRPHYQLDKELRYLIQWVTAPKAKVSEVYIDALESCLRVYLLRKYSVLSMRGQLRSCFEKIKKNHKKVYDRTKGSFFRLATELDSAKKNTEKLTQDDVLQLLRSARQWGAAVDRVDVR